MGRGANACFFFYVKKLLLSVTCPQGGSPLLCGVCTESIKVHSSVSVRLQPHIPGSGAVPPSKCWINMGEKVLAVLKCSWVRKSVLSRSAFESVPSRASGPCMFSAAFVRANAPRGADQFRGRQSPQGGRAHGRRAINDGSRAVSVVRSAPRGTRNSSLRVFHRGPTFQILPPS